MTDWQHGVFPSQPTTSRPLITQSLHKHHRDTAAIVVKKHAHSQHRTCARIEPMLRHHYVINTVQHSPSSLRRMPLRCISPPRTRRYPRRKTQSYPGSHPSDFPAPSVRRTTLSITIYCSSSQWTIPIRALANKMPIRVLGQARSGPTPKTSSAHTRLASIAGSARQNASWVPGQMEAS